MNQYKDKSKVAALLRGPIKERSGVKVVNDMVEITMENQRAVVPAMETITKLIARIGALEQRLAILENRINRVGRGVSNEHRH